MIYMETPILFLVFNRPGLTKIVFEEIKKAKPSELFVAIDGPRQGNPNDLENINKILEIVKNIDWECKFKILQREQNLGCGLAISSAIDWFFSYVEEGIILEDDCVPSPDFFVFCKEMLEKYRCNDKVMAINGSNPFSNKDLYYSYAFTSYNLIWGWATWRSAWNYYQYDLSNTCSFSRATNLLKKFKFDIISARSWYKHLNLAMDNLIINTWDYQWIYACFKNNGKIIIPKVNLIENIGDLEDPTHGMINMFYSANKTQKLNFPLVHPSKIFIDKDLEYKIKKERFGNTFYLLLISKLKKMRKQLLLRKINL